MAYEILFSNEWRIDEFLIRTRMHSSRMRTGRALTVSGRGGVGASQKKFFGGKEIEKKKRKKIWRPPKNWRPPEKLENPQKLETPLEKLETPKKLENPPKNWRPPPPQDQTPPVDRHTLVKILPWPNFVAAGNNDMTNFWLGTRISATEDECEDFLKFIRYQIDVGKGREGGSNCVKCQFHNFITGNFWSPK